jgi:YVTN family beta-propeller protein
MRYQLSAAVLLAARLTTAAADPAHAVSTGSTLYAFAANDQGDSVSVIDVATDTVTATIAGFSLPSNVSVTPSGTMALVADGVHKISTRTDKIVGSGRGPGEPRAVGITPNGKKMYIADSLKFVYGFNVSTLRQTAKI